MNKPNYGTDSWRKFLATDGGQVDVIINLGDEPEFSSLMSNPAFRQAHHRTGRSWLRRNGIPLECEAAQ